MSTYQGSLALQLISNHYYKPFDEINEAKYKSFPKRQVEVNVNLTSPRWLDWFYGGLHFHIEHHCFPTMPRYNLRLVSKDIKKLMKENAIDYDHHYLPYVLYKVCSHLKEVRNQYISDYRNKKNIEALDKIKEKTQ